MSLSLILVVVVDVWVDFVSAVQGKRLELSTPNLLDVYSMAVSQRALTLRSKGQGRTSEVYLVRCRREWVCMSI